MDIFRDILISLGVGGVCVALKILNDFNLRKKSDYLFDLEKTPELSIGDYASMKFIPHTRVPDKVFLTGMVEQSIYRRGKKRFTGVPVIKKITKSDVVL